MKYYLYISESKVQMLAAQLPEPHRPKQTMEAGLNIGVAKASLKSERQPPEKTLHSKVEEVIAHIRANEDVGTIDNPRNWIAGTVSARFVLLRDDKEVIFFVGETDDGVVFGLGGSRGNLTTDTRPEGVGVGWSFLPFLLRALRTSVSSPGSVIDPFSGREFEATMSRNQKSDWIQFLREVERAPLDPPLEIEFFARTLLTDRDPQTSMNGVLATPIYVAQV